MTEENKDTEKTISLPIADRGNTMYFRQFNSHLSLKLDESKTNIEIIGSEKINLEFNKNKSINIDLVSISLEDFIDFIDSWLSRYGRQELGKYTSKDPKFEKFLGESSMNMFYHDMGMPLIKLKSITPEKIDACVKRLYKLKAGLESMKDY